MSKIGSFLFVAVVSIASSACSSGSSAPSGGTSSDCTTPVEATWTSIQANVMNGSCALSNSCHQGNAAGVLQLDGDSKSTYSRVVNVPSAIDAMDKYVVPGHPEQSLLYRKVLGDGGADCKATKCTFSGLDCSNQDSVTLPSGTMAAGCGVQMPQNGPYLQQCQITAIHDWIQNGADNN